jgi:hypothetical protein
MGRDFVRTVPLDRDEGQREICGGPVGRRVVGPAQRAMGDVDGRTQSSA